MKSLSSYLTNIIAPSTGYSEGQYKDNPGDDTGTGMTAQAMNDILYALFAVITKYDAVSNTNETEAASDFLDALEAAFVALTGNQTVAGDKTFSGTTNATGALQKDGNPVVTTSSGTQTIAGNKTLSGTNTHSGTNTFSGSVDFSEHVRPKTGPTLGEVAIYAGDYHTPARGFYNASSMTNRGGLYNAVSAGSGSMGGPYSGTSDTRVYNNTSDNYYWRSARF